MHSGFDRPRGALHGVMAHQARASNPVPSHALFAERDDLAPAPDVCTLGLALRWRSRGAARAAGAEATGDRFGAVDTATGVAPVSARDVCCASGFIQSATGSGSGERTGNSAADGAVDAVVASVVTDANAGIGATADVAAIFVVIAVPASGVESAAPEGGNDGRSKVQAPQPSATTPVNASEIAKLT